MEETKKEIKTRHQSKYGISITPDSDFTKLPDEILANAHLYDWVDKFSIQANVEMTRRLKTAVQSLEETTISLNKRGEKIQKIILWLTIVGVGLGITQIPQAVEIIKNWFNTPTP
jgi:hypothetical protein